jgi:hypothetical protein
MKKLITAAFFATTLTAGYAQAQSATAKPGNCAVWSEEAAKTVRADARFDAALKTEVASALDTFAKAQRKIMADGMAKTYADSKTFGWDKAKVDEMIAKNETAMRKGFRTSTMEENKLYMDHLMAINNCIQANPSDSQYGMSRASFIATLEKTIPIVRGG